MLTWTQVFSRLSLTPRAHHLWVPEHMSGGQGSAGSLVCPQCVCAYSECLLRQHPCVPIAWQHNSAPSLCAVTFVPSLEVAVCQTRICTGERKQWHRSDINTLHVQVTVRMHRWDWGSHSVPTSPNCVAGSSGKVTVRCQLLGGERLGGDASWPPHVGDGQQGCLRAGQRRNEHQVAAQLW